MTTSRLPSYPPDPPWIRGGQQSPRVRETIVRLLSNMGSSREVRQYLKRFSQLDATRFALVKVGADVLSDDLDALSSSLAFLQEVGLSPVVLHGAGKLIARSRRPSLPIAAVLRSLRTENMRMTEALHAIGARATSILGGVIEARGNGRKGRVIKIDRTPIEASIKAGSIPIVAALGVTSAGKLVEIDEGAATYALAAALEPYKIIYLTEAGGIVNDGGGVIESVNLATEYDALARALSPEARATVRGIKALLDDLPLASSVSITEPRELAEELFTHKGSGTLVRRGEKIRRYTRFSRLDKPRLVTLVESSFKKKLVADYFDRTKLYRAYVSAHYRAGLILTRESGIAHLDKFAVADDAQGEGLGRAAWQVMRAENPRLFWRSRPNNPINDFYLAEADGCVKGERWNVFWYGLRSFDEIAKCVDHCRARPATLKG